MNLIYDMLLRKPGESKPDIPTILSVANRDCLIPRITVTPAANMQLIDVLCWVYPDNALSLLEHVYYISDYDDMGKLIKYLHN